MRPSSAGPPLQRWRGRFQAWTVFWRALRIAQSIEPETKLLRSMLRPGDECRIKIIEKQVYLVRAFLMYNQTFRIEFFNDYVRETHLPQISAVNSLFEKSLGSSLWLRKVKA